MCLMVLNLVGGVILYLNVYNIESVYGVKGATSVKLNSGEVLKVTTSIEDTVSMIRNRQELCEKKKSI